MRLSALLTACAVLFCAALCAAETPSAKSLPKLVDLGAKKCVQCKQMAPVLEDLKKEFDGQFAVEFIDVSLKENAALAEKYKAGTIPLQIFLDADGKELWRHTGFFSREDILSKWKELKYDFSAASKKENAKGSGAKE